MNYKTKILIVGIFMLILFILFFVGVNIKQEKIFNDNVIMFETKAKNYIIYNKLPIEKKEVITLEELNEKEIVPKLYYNFNECNNKSYIVIEKKENFYEMTSTLICDNKTEVIKTYFN